MSDKFVMYSNGEWRAGGLGNISKRQDKLWYVGEDGYSSQAFYHLLQIEGVEHVQVLK